jgi:hypothetical protein
MMTLGQNERQAVHATCHALDETQPLDRFSSQRLASDDDVISVSSRQETPKLDPISRWASTLPPSDPITPSSVPFDSQVLENDRNVETRPENEQDLDVPMLGQFTSRHHALLVLTPPTFLVMETQQPSDDIAPIEPEETIDCDCGVTVSGLELCSTSADWSKVRRYG